MNLIAKKSALVLAGLLIAGGVQAATPGFYVGGGLGYADLNTNNPYKHTTIEDADSSSMRSSNTNFGYRLFTGWNYNQYVGLEFGYANYGSAENKFSMTNGFITDDQSYAFMGNLDSKINHDLSAISLVGKAYYPIGDSGFNVYALAGVARVNNSASYTTSATGAYVTENDLYVANGSTHKSSTTHDIRPVYGLGVSYDINQSFSADLEWSHLQGKGNTGNIDLDKAIKAVPSANLFTLSAVYSFGN